jgi:uncharacterized protein (DUF305 family)
MNPASRWINGRTAFTAAAVLVSALSLGGGGVTARQNDHSGHAGHDNQTTDQKGMSAASHEMHESMMKGMKDMHSMKMSGDPDHDFATMMRQHHAHGIEMAQAYLKGAKDAEMQQMAQKIVDSQKQDNQKFDQFLAAHKPQAGQAAGGGGSHDLHQAMMKSMGDMDSMKMTGDADHDFAMMMREHHQHGVEMAEAYLPGAKSSDMKQMAEKIVAEQRDDIKKFDAWLSGHGHSAMP